MQEIHVVGAAIRDGNKILAAQRSEKMSVPLKWEFVGGKVEQGETHEQALERELTEEMGIKIRVGKYIASGSEESNGRKIILHVYEAEILDGEPTAREHAQIRWVDISELERLDWAIPDIPACEELLRMYGR